VSGIRYNVTDVVIETPRYPASGVMGMAVGPEHDLIGHGWVEVDQDYLVVAIQPDGIIGHLEPKEKRRYSFRRSRVGEYRGRTWSSPWAPSEGSRQTGRRLRSTRVSFN
jgi:hypothetical protein